MWWRPHLLLLQHRAFSADAGPFIASADSFCERSCLVFLLCHIFVCNRFDSCVNCFISLIYFNASLSDGDFITIEEAKFLLSAG